MPLSPESLYMRLGDLVRSMPDLREEPRNRPETANWLAKAYALILASGVSGEAERLKRLTNFFVHGNDTWAHSREISAIVDRALAVAELNAPAAIQGAFIPAGNAFDAMAAVGKVLQEAKQTLLIVDPYMDEKVLTDFAGLAPPGVALQLMADQKNHKLTLKPAVMRWAAQHGAARPIEARLAAPRSPSTLWPHVLQPQSSAWTLRPRH